MVAGYRKERKTKKEEAAGIIKEMQGLYKVLLQ